MLPADQVGVSGPDHFDTSTGAPRHLFSSPRAGEPSLNREYIPHIAAYARAILDLCYDSARSSFSRYRKYGRDLLSKRSGGSYETDAEFYDSEGGIHLHVEAKKDARQVGVIADQLDRATGLHDLPLGTVKEIEYVLDLSPRYLWVVGPGSIDPARHVFRVTVDGLNAAFERVERFPDPPT